MKYTSPFAERLKLLIRERDLTQREVAEVAGVTKNAVGKWIRGTVPGAGEVFKLAQAFQKPMEWFFEAIPYNPAANKALDMLPPAQVPVDHVPPELRSFYAAMFEMLSTPQGIEVFHQRFKQLYPTAARPAEPSKEKAKQVLTESSDSVISAPMKSELQELLVAARRLTRPRGMKSKLAQKLEVPLPRVSDWLAGKYLPSGERALKLRDWVREQEGQQEQSPASVPPPAGPKTQSKASHENIPRSRPPKS